MFTKEEVEAAKATRDSIIQGDILELKMIYIAGEIVMWDECEQKNLHKAHVNGRLSDKECTDCGCPEEICKMIKGKCKNLAYR